MRPPATLALLLMLFILVPPVSACTTTTQTSAAATTSPPAPSPDSPIEVLAAAPIDEPLPHVFGGSQASAVVRFGDRLLAFGGVNGGCCDGSFSTDTHAAIWTSIDGRQWRLAPAGPEFALGVVRDAAATPDRIVVVGALRLESTLMPGGEAAPAVWVSADGNSWALFRDVPLLTRVEATGDGFIGVSNVKAFPELWWSRTGRDWELIAGKEELGAGRISQLLSTPVGLVAVGSTVNPDAWTGSGPPPEGDAAVWLSPDARSWTKVPTTDARASAVMNDVAWVGGNLLAIGMDATLEQNLVWISDGGREWVRVPEPPVDGGSITQLTMVVGLPDRFAIAGNWRAEPAEEFGLALWTTRDGLAWRRIDAAHGRPGDEVIAAIVVDDGGAAFLGASSNVASGRRVPGAWLLEAAR